MVRKNDCYIFYFHKLIKTWRKGKTPPALIFMHFPEKSKTLHDYLKVTKKWSLNEDYSHLLLSTSGPHKQVVKSTIVGG